MAIWLLLRLFVFLFFFNDTATTEIYTLSLHDALPILLDPTITASRKLDFFAYYFLVDGNVDRKSTRLNSSHGYISYAVFCLKKKHTYKHSVPRFFVPEHVTMFTLALVRFPPTSTKEIH